MLYGTSGVHVTQPYQDLDMAVICMYWARVQQAQITRQDAKADHRVATTVMSSALLHGGVGLWMYDMRGAHTSLASHFLPMLRLLRTHCMPDPTVWQNAKVNLK